MSDLAVLDTDPDPSGSVGAVDAEGNATSFDDVPTIVSSDESVATASMDASGAITITKTGKTGATMFTVSSTRSSDGVVLTGTATLTVNPSEETALEINLTPGEAAAPTAPADAAPVGDTAPAGDGTSAPADATAPTDANVVPPPDAPPAQ